jgi:hypothetical protein
LRVSTFNAGNGIQGCVETTARDTLPFGHPSQEGKSYHVDDFFRDDYKTGNAIKQAMPVCLIFAQGDLFTLHHFSRYKETYYHIC